jgi:hypothetical protein
MDSHFQTNENIIQNISSIRRNIERRTALQYEQLNCNNTQTNNLQTNNTQLNNLQTNNTQTNTQQFTIDNIINHSMFDTIINTINLINEADSTNIAISNFLNTIFDNVIENEYEDVKVTLSQEQFNKLERIKIEELEQEQNCIICLQALTKYADGDQTLVILKCKHIYHLYCIQEWLTKFSTKCPSCRLDCRNL